MDVLIKIRGQVAMDLGSVSTGYSDRPVARAIKIKHAGLNLTGRRKEKFMSRRPGRGMQKVYIGHLRWLQDQGQSYKHQAASCKRQAASLTRDLYCVIQSYKLKEKV